MLVFGHVVSICGHSVLGVWWTCVLLCELSLCSCCDSCLCIVDYVIVYDCYMRFVCVSVDLYCFMF